MKKILIIGLLIANAAYADKPRELEPVLNISANSAEMLFSEDILLVSYEATAQLLGDDMSLSLDALNSLPATAAGNNNQLKALSAEGGNETIHLMSFDAAEELLGDSQ